MKDKDIFILGAGRLAAEVYHWVNHTGRYNVVGFYDAICDGNGAMFGLPVYNDVSKFSSRATGFVVGVGDPNVKKSLFANALLKGFTPVTVIHPTAIFCNDTELGKGCIVCPNVIVTTNVSIGDGVVINIGSTIGHDCKIGDFVTISPSANISGNCDIGELSYIGTNSCIREKVSIANETMVGMGSVVVRSYDQGGTLIGNPAKMVPTKG